MSAVISRHTSETIDIATIEQLYAQARKGLLQRLNRHVTGGGRQVYAVDDKYVLKLNTDYAKWGDNLTEAALWENKPELHEYLAACIAWSDDGDWLLMERCTNVGQYEWSDFDDEQRHALRSAGIRDQHAQNIGESADGRLVSIDYGCNGYRTHESADVSSSIRESSVICRPSTHRCIRCEDRIDLHSSEVYCQPCLNQICKGCYNTLENSARSHCSSCAHVLRLVMRESLEAILRKPIKINANGKFEDSYQEVPPHITTAERADQHDRKAHADWRRGGKHSFEALWMLPIYVIGEYQQIGRWVEVKTEWGSIRTQQNKNKFIGLFEAQQ